MTGHGSWTEDKGEREERREDRRQFMSWSWSWDQDKTEEGNETWKLVGTSVRII